MDKEQAIKFLSCITAIVQDGQIVVKDKHAIVSHSDTSNVAYIRCESTFDIVDGTFGLEFARLLTATNSAKSKVVNYNFDKSDYNIQYDKTKHNFAGLNLSTLPTIRPDLNPDFPCVVELDKAEFNDIMSVMEKNNDAQQNDLTKIMVAYDGKTIKFRVQQDERDFVEREIELMSVEKGTGQKFVSYYPMDFLIRISNAVKKLNTTSLSIGFGNDSPIMIKAKDEVVDVKYMIAPRIDPE